jgi:hypothetical protein
MTNVNWERWARASGIVFVVLFVVAYIIYGEQPKVGASGEELVSFYDGDRGRVLTASIIFSVAILFLIWFAASIASTLREAGQGGWGAATIGSSATLAAVFYVLILLGIGLSYSIAGTGDPGVTAALNDLAWAAVVMVAFPGALVIFAATMGLWRAGIVATWYGWTGLAATIVALLAGTTWTTDGFWAPDGAYSRFVAPIVVLAWIAVTSGILYARTSTEAAPERAAIPTP